MRGHSLVSSRAAVVEVVKAVARTRPERMTQRGACRARSSLSGTVANRDVSQAAMGVNTICPSFSPDGTKLSYMHRDDVVILGARDLAGPAIVRRRVDSHTRLTKSD